MPAPYHVRLAISQYGEQFRAELFTEDLGDTEGDMLAELPPSIAEWVPYLAQGADLPPDAARQLGKDLFAALLGQPENAKKWSEVLTQAGRKGQPIRLLIDATTEAVRDLPYGLLCEPHDDWFLFRGKKQPVEFVRILRRCSPRPLKLRDRLRVLIAVAEPKSADVPPFDAPQRLQRLAAALHKEIELVVCGLDGPKPLAAIAPNPDTAEAATFAPFTKTTRDHLRKALGGEFDVFHLLAHGHGAGVLLCTEDGAPAETTASELGEWCGAGKTALAFLQVCKAGQTAGRGGFGGVAQQLLNPRSGNMAAVVASTFPLDAEHSTGAAVGFYRQLAAGKPPEEALTAERPESDWCWAFLELWARPGALGGGTQRAAFQFVSPYRGLSSFGEQDADLFFGRKTEVAELLHILRAEPAVAVVGDSGSGKTSLLQAGLVHAIRRDGLAGSDKWRIVTLRPGYRPAQSLLTAVFGGSKGGESTTTDPQTLRNAVASALQTTDQPLVIVFDQFEEVFTLARDKAEVQMLIDALVEAVEHQPDRFRLVLGMRSEFLGQAASVPGLSRLIRRPWVLRPPSSDDLRDIVGGPAEHCGYSFQGPLADGNPAHAVGLLDRILADPLLARDQAGATAAPLPLLQFALERLWLKAVEKGVTEFAHAEFDEIGGMGKAIAQHAEAVFQASATATEVGPPARGLAEQIITALVSTRGTRQPRVRDALQAETGNPEAARAVVDYLVGERLLTIRTDPEDMSKSLVDLSHEVLIHSWERLKGWLAEDPQGRAMREEFRTAAEKWESGFAGVQPRSWYALPGADVARNYLAWIRTHSPRLAPVQQEFAQAMRDMLARLRRRRQIVMAILGALTIASCVLAFYADGQARKAEANAQAAKAEEEKAKESEKKAKEEEEKAKRAQRDEARKAAVLALENGIRMCEQGRPRLGILGIAYSLDICPPDAPDLRHVILTNLAAWGPHLMCLDGVRTLPGPIIATDRTGKYALVELGRDQATSTVRFFNIETQQPVWKPVLTQWYRSDGSLSLQYRVVRATILPTGIALLAGPANASVWNMVTGTQIGATITDDTSTAVLSPDAKVIAVGGLDGNVRLYDGVTGQPHPGLPMPHQGRIAALAFSADGRYLATGCGRRASAKKDAKTEAHPEDHAGFIHLFEITGGAKPSHRLVWRHPMPVVVSAVEISQENPADPGKTRVVGGGFELHALRLVPKKDTLEAERAEEGPRFSPESTVQLTFNPKDNAEYLACNPSGALQVLHRNENLLLSGERLSPQGWVSGTGYRTDGRLFTANNDGTVRIWHRPHDGQTEVAHARKFEPRDKGGNKVSGGVQCVAFSPDGKRIALGCKNGIVYVYELTKNEGSDPRSYACVYDPDKEERRQVTDVRFSTDGTRIVAQDDYLNVFVFDLNGSAVDASGNRTPIKGRQLPLGVAPDGRTAIVSGKGKHEYQLAQVGSPDLPTGPAMVLEDDGPWLHDETTDDYFLRVSRFAFTPDNAIVAIAHRLGAVHLFRTATGEQIAGPLRHLVENELDGIRAVAFCPKGQCLLTRSERARGMWNARTGAPIHFLSNRIGVQVARFGPGGSHVLGGTNFNMAEVWDSTGRRVNPVPLMHGAQVWGLAENPTETQLVTASFDRSARIWDIATGKPLTPPLLHDRGVSDAVFSPDGKRVLTGSWDGTARLWDVPVPLADEPERIMAWVETMTGLRVGLHVTGDMLTADQWRERKAELDRLGGPPAGAVK